MNDKNEPAAPADLSLIEHLAELRLRLIKGLLAALAGCLAAWNVAGDILNFILKPVLDLLPEGQGLIYTGLQDGFVISLKASLWAGVLASSPVWMYQLWAFVAPALYPREKKQAAGLAALSAALVLAGAAFAYFLAFPLAFNFFINFSTDHLQPLLAVDRYCSLAMSLILAFALAFQLPLVLMFLGRLGLVDSAFLRRNRRYSILAAFVLGAVLTPPDVISQGLLAGALLILYELSIFLVGRPQAGDEAGDEADQP